MSLSSLPSRLGFRSIAVAITLALASANAPGATHNPVDGPGLNTLLNGVTLQMGDTIVLNAGTTYTGTFVLPVKSGSGYITIQSSQMGSLPPAGQRIKAAYPNPADPDHRPFMPKIRPANGGGTSTRAIKTAPGAHHYKLIGLEIIGMADNAAQTSLVDLGDPGSAQDTLAEVPHNIIIDRCIIRANSGSQALRRGIALHSASTDIINSHIADCKDVGSGDSQAIGGSNGPGPYNVINNFLEAASENILFGGSPVHVPNVIPTDIVVRQNHLYKPMSWRGTTSWNVKNHFELKSGVNVTLDSNILENCWHMAGDQKGKSISFKTIRQSDQGSPWTLTENVTVTNNVIRNVGTGISLGGNTAYPTGTLNGHPRNITFRNNLFHDITDGATWPGNSGYYALVLNGPQNVTFDRNTAFAVNRIMDIGTAQGTGWVWINNINHAGPSYSFKGEASGGTSEQAFIDWLPGLIFRKNVVKGAASSGFLPNYHGDWNPTSLAFPTTWSGVLADPNGLPGTNYAGWKATGTYATAAVNAAGTALSPPTPIGCDIDAVNAATAGCISGVWSGPPVTVTLKNGVNGYAGATSFMASGQSPTTWHGPARFHTDSNRHSPTGGFVLRSFFKFDVSSIPAGKTIDSATLRVKIENTPGANVFLNAHRVAPVGGAFTVNYAAATRNSPLGNATTWTGGTNAGGAPADANNDYLDTPDDSELVGGPAVYSLDVTSSVQAWVSGTPNNGWVLMPNQSGSNVVIYMGTPADSHGPGEYPELEITYH